MFWVGSFCIKIGSASHPAIIDNETWETVQRIRSNRRQVTRTYEKGALEGTVFCLGCGERLYAKRNSRTNNDGSVREYCYYVCKNSRTYSDIASCTSHSIQREDIEAVVLKDMQRVLKLAKTEEQKFVEKLSTASRKESERGLQKAKNELAKAKTRIGTLDRIISKIYEDNVEGKISDERFATMLTGYETEQSDLKLKATELESIICEATAQTTGIENFLRLVRSYTEVTELSTEIVHEFIEKVLVGEAEYTEPRFSHWARGKTQEIRIIYNYIGDVTETIKDE